MSDPPGGDKKNIVKMAYIYFREGRWDKAIEEYKKLITLDAEDLNTHNLLGDVYVKKGADSEAFEEYLNVLNGFSSRGQFEKIPAIHKKIAALNTDLLLLSARKKQEFIRQIIRGDTALENNDEDEAVEAFSQALQFDPENLDVCAKLADLYEKRQDIPNAVRQLSYLGELLLKNRQYKKAQESFQKAVQLDSGNVEAHLQLAQIYTKQGSESDAKREYLALSEICLDQGDLEKAESYAVKAVEFKSIEAHFILGSILFKKKRFPEAKAQLETLLRFKVGHVRALTTLALILMEENHLDKAGENLQKALKAQGGDPQALEAWARLCLKKGSKPEAITTFMALADGLLSKQNVSQAVEAVKNVLSIDGDSLSANLKLAELLALKGDHGAAAPAFLKTGSLYEKQGQMEKAAEFFRKAAEIGQLEAAERAKKAPPPPEEAPAAAPPRVEEKREGARPAVAPGEDIQAQLAIAEDYVKRGMAEEAIEIYQQLLAAHPDDGTLREKLNKVYTAYAKTGEDVLGVLEAEKREKEEVEKRLREKMETQVREEAKRVRAEIAEKARLEAERKVRREREEREERERREEAERKRRQEEEYRARREREEREERERREEAERKRRQEEERRARLELEKISVKKEPKAPAEPKVEHKKIQEKAEGKEPARMPPVGKTDAEKAGPLFPRVGGRFPMPAAEPSVGAPVSGESADELETVAVAEILERQGLLQEALRIYQKLAEADSDDMEVQVKMRRVEGLLKARAAVPLVAPPPPRVSAPPPSAPPKLSTPAPPPPKVPAILPKGPNGDKRASRIGYV